jgi:hypothetical protein
MHRLYFLPSVFICKITQVVQYFYVPSQVVQYSVAGGGGYLPKTQALIRRGDRFAKQRCMIFVKNTNGPADFNRIYLWMSEPRVNTHAHWLPQSMTPFNLAKARSKMNIDKK